MESEFDFEIMIEGDGGEELPDGMREMIMESIMSSMSDEADDEDKPKKKRSKNKGKQKKNPDR